MVLYLDLELVPLTRPVCDDTLIESLGRRVVDRARRAEFRVDILTRRRVSAPERVDLHLESEIHSDERGVVVAFALNIGKTQENAGIVILSPREPLQFQDVVIKWDLRIEKSEIGAGRRLESAVDSVEPAGIVPPRLVADRRHLPTRWGHAVKEQCESRVGLWGWPRKMIAQALRQRGTRKHGIRRTDPSEKAQAQRRRCWPRGETGSPHS